MKTLLTRVKSSRLLSSTVVGLPLMMLFLGTAASADGGTTTYNGCQNVYTGIIRLLPNQLSAPLKACILSGSPILRSQISV
jgi:hypothetical protein